MRQEKILVYLGDIAHPIGTLWFESAPGSRAHSSFQYTPEWLEHPRGFAIAPALPLNFHRHFFRVEEGGRTPLPLVIADTTPDSWGRSIIRKDDALNKRSGRPLDELDFLLAVDDLSRMGALRFRESVDTPFLSAKAQQKHPIPPLIYLDQLGRDIANLESGDPTVIALRRLRQVGTVFGGARPKCAVVDNDGALAIAKFTSREDTYAVERAEVMTLWLARLCGINTPDARVEMSDGLPVAIIKRFDRSGQNRIPFMSAQTLLDSPAATGRTYIEIADALRQYGESPQEMMEELFRRISFTILVSNVDDHLKNHGLLYSGGGKWRLSPAFDINPAPERFKELKTAIADPAEPSASISLLLDHAFFFEIGQDDAVKTVAAMAKTVADNWQAMGRRAGMSSQEIASYIPAFEHEESRYALQCAAKILSGAKPMQNEKAECQDQSGAEASAVKSRSKSDWQCG